MPEVDSLNASQKPKVNWKRLSITVVIVLVTAGVIGGTVWYFMNDAVKVKDSHIDSLEGQVSTLQERKDEGTEEATTDSVTDETEKETVSVSYDDYQTVLAVAVYGRSGQLNDENYVVRHLDDAWAIVEFRSHPDMIGYSGLVLAKKNGEWVKAQSFNQGGDKEYFNRYKEIDIPSSIFTVVQY